MGERKRETVKEREREREKYEESMKIGKESARKTDVPKLYAYNECEHSVTKKTPQRKSNWSKKEFVYFFPN